MEDMGAVVKTAHSEPRGHLDGAWRGTGAMPVPRLLAAQADLR